MTYISKMTRGLHWIIAVLMIMLFIAGQRLEALEGADRLWLARLHGSVGMSVFFLGIWRLIHRLREGFPEPLNRQHFVLETMARVVHWLLLLLPILLPISGIMIFLAGGGPIYFFGIEIFGGFGERSQWLRQIGGQGHDIGTKLLFVAVILHVLGALKHHIIDKDRTIMRMFVGR